MFKIKLYTILILILSSISIYANDYPFPPYYFSADIREMSRVFDELTVNKQITADIIKDDIKYINNRKITAKDKANLELNRNIDGIKSTIILLYGITKRSTNMRMYPSNDILHKGDKRFDYNQYTRIPPFTSLAILHISHDKRFYYVQAPNMRGWVAKDDISLQPYEFVKKVIEMDYVTVLKDNITLAGVSYNLGDRVPVTIRDGVAYMRNTAGKEFRLNVDNDTLLFKSFPYSDEVMLKYINSLLGSKYDWGGKSGRRDCSSFTGDLFSLFNIKLPRNTSLQAQTGKVIANNLKSAEQFYNILDEAKPFLTLIFFKGHVFIYGGKEGDDYILYHSVNKLRNDTGDDINLNSVVKTRIKGDNFTNIWKRVTRIIEVDTNNKITE